MSERAGSFIFDWESERKLFFSFISSEDDKHARARHANDGWIVCIKG